MTGKPSPEARGALERRTAERLREIVAGAERAAAAVIDEAEGEARRRLAGARDEADRLVVDRLSSLAELTDSLISRAEEIHRQSEVMIAALEEARVGLEADAPARESSPRAAHRSHLSPVPLAVAPEPPDDAGQAPAGGTPAGARLLATQMAISGSSREEIATRLRNGFEIEDTTAILNAILGAED